jgi:hypothetical protein
MVSLALRSIKLEIHLAMEIRPASIPLSIKDSIGQTRPSSIAALNFDFRIHDYRGRPSTRWTWHDEAPQEIQCAADEPSPILRQTMSYNKM